MTAGATFYGAWDPVKGALAADAHHSGKSSSLAEHMPFRPWEPMAEMFAPALLNPTGNSPTERFGREALTALMTDEAYLPVQAIRLADHLVTLKHARHKIAERVRKGELTEESAATSLRGNVERIVAVSHRLGSDVGVELLQPPSPDDRRTFARLAFEILSEPGDRTPAANHLLHDPDATLKAYGERLRSHFARHICARPEFDNLIKGLHGLQRAMDDGRLPSPTPSTSTVAQLNR